NLPEVRSRPADAVTLRAEARAAYKTGTASRFNGVHRYRGAWMAKFRIPGLNNVYLGYWKTETGAARAHDRALRCYGGPENRLNFPGGKLPPATPAELRRLAKNIRKATKTASKYRGVTFRPSQPNHPWSAVIGAKKKKFLLGSWASEKAAAKAYDRAARFYFGS